jgi:hypothetical protein
VAHRVAAGSAQSADGLLKRTAEMKAIAAMAAQPHGFDRLADIALKALR